MFWKLPENRVPCVSQQAQKTLPPSFLDVHLPFAILLTLKNPIEDPVQFQRLHNIHLDPEDGVIDPWVFWFCFFPPVCCSKAETLPAVEFRQHKRSQLYQKAEIVLKCLLFCLCASSSQWSWVGLDHSQLSYPLLVRDVVPGAGITPRRLRVQRFKLTSVLNNSPLSLKVNYYLFSEKCIPIHPCSSDVLWILKLRKRQSTLFPSYWIWSTQDSNHNV